jgi:hypothetical protein
VPTNLDSRAPALEMLRRGKVWVSVATMGRALAALGASLKRGNPIVECPWPGWKRQRRLWELRCLATFATEDEPVLYEDEADIHLNPKIGRDWCLRNQRRTVRTPGNNESASSPARWTPAPVRFTG